MPGSNRTDERIRQMANFPDNNPNPIIEMDSRGKITFTNLATLITLNELGLPENPILFVPDDRDEILRLLKESVESQLEREIKLNTAWFLEKIALDHELHVVRIFAVNITRRKQAEMDLVRKNEELFTINLQLTSTREELSRELELNRRSEKELRASEENLHRTLELLEAVTRGTEVIIAVQDMNFRYVFFNQAYKEDIKRLTGKDLTIGTSMIELFEDFPEEQTKTVKEWRRVLNGEPVDQIIEFGDHGADARVYRVLHTPIRDTGGCIVGAGEVAYDLTRQVHIEDALRETKEYLDNLINYANAPIIVWDPQFRITLFNRAFEHLTGRKAKDVLGKQFDILLPGSYKGPVMDLIRKTLEGDRWESVEIPILDKDGATRTILWNSSSIFGADGKTIVSTIAQGQDITDRKRIESSYRLQAAEYAELNLALEKENREREISDIALKNTLSLLNASLEATADGIYVVDLHGQITSYNQNFVNMWNIPRDLTDSGENERVMKYVSMQLSDPKEFLVNLKDLRSHPTRESFDMIEFKDGRIFERYSKPQNIGNTVVGRVWSFRDITDRKHAEEKLVASLLEKEVLIREIHHRVKNNLQLMSDLLDMTRMRSGDELTKSILTDMMLKIQTMAQIHSKL